MIYLVLFLLTLIVIAVVYYIFFMPKKTVYTKEAFKDIKVTQNAIKHTDLGLFVALVAKLVNDKDSDSLQTHLIDIMLNDIAAIYPRPHETKQILNAILKEQQNRDDNISSIAIALNKSTKNDLVKQQQFLEFLAQIIYLDVETMYETEILMSISDAFSVPPKIYKEIYKQYKRTTTLPQEKINIKEVYKLLNVSEHSSLNSIKESYVKELKKHHLNIVDKRSNDELFDTTYGEYTFVQSTLKLKELAHAYEMIKKAQRA